MNAPALPRVIGQTERTMRTLLERELGRAGLTFPEWTALVFIDISGPLPREELIRRQVQGHIASPDAAGDAVDRLRSAGLLAPAGDAPAPEAREPRLALTAEGEALFRPLRTTVSQTTEKLFGDLPPGDIQATQRTLAEVARRGTAMLAGTSIGADVEHPAEP